MERYSSQLSSKEGGMSTSSKPKAHLSAGPHAILTRVIETGEATVQKATRDQETRRRACEIYLERGEGSGCDELDDWLQAERELVVLCLRM
jgi:hypothetical protein